MFEMLLIKPLVNLLVMIYSLLPYHDFGLAIILLTVIVRAILWPIQSHTLRSQKALTKIQPEVKKIQEKYKNDPQKMQAMVMELYKEKEVNPLSSCLPSLIQLPLLFALFYAFIKFKDDNFIKLADPNTGVIAYLYDGVYNLGFVKNALTGTFQREFLGFIDLAKPNVIFAVLAGLAQFLQTKLMMPQKSGDNDQAAQMNKMMLYMFPALTLFAGLSFPAALPLYWITTTLVAALQQYLIMHHDVEELEEGVIEAEVVSEKPKAKKKATTKK
jgi:YidC/Oxa1 family membrane protein insertase